MKEKLVWALFVGVAACAVAAVVGLWLRKPGKFPKAPDFKLVERSGKPLSKRDLMGEVWVGQFVFTRCAGSCPMMMSRMYVLHKAFPQAKYVSFTVDPVHDTPEVLAAYAKNNTLPPEWLFLTGTHEQMQDVAKKGFLLSMEPGGRPEEPIIHSDRFVLVDRVGRWRGTYAASDPEKMAELQAELRKVLAERAIPVTKLPAVNAGLNGAATVCLLVGFLLIRAKRIGAHKAFMLLALCCSALFLASYLTAHHFLGSTPYPGQGAMRTVYFSILITHTILAALIVPLAGITVVRAFRDQIDRHKALARWTFPLWLYVSVTGVVIYFMLYR